jgi:hypothetical protein
VVAKNIFFLIKNFRIRRGKRKNINSLPEWLFTFYAFLPKALMIVARGRSSGLLPVEHLPIPKNSGMKIQQFNYSLQLRG